MSAVLIAKPRRASITARLSAAAVAGVFVVIAVLLGGHGPGATPFSLPSQLGVAAIGILGGAAILVFTRPRVHADEHGVRIRNLMPTPHIVTWDEVVGVRFGGGEPWAFLLLADGDEAPMLAIQTTDGERAEAAVRTLRDLHDAHRAG